MKKINYSQLIPFFILAALVSSQGFTDSLFSTQVADRGTSISDLKVRFKVGDIVTVQVRATIDASTSSNTDTKKESEISSQAAAANNPFLLSGGGLGVLDEGQLPNWGIEAENEHKSSGATKRSSKLTMTVTCSVIQVFENGNILLEGMKMITVNRETSRLMLSGLARPQDVTPANTIKSEQLASARIELNGKGPLWKNQRRGWLTKALDWFSPF
jgi:flagellar L-ring protein precursor FlgH